MTYSRARLTAFASNGFVNAFALGKRQPRSWLRESVVASTCSSLGAFGKLVSSAPNGAPIE
jgi:hypothetical protein